MKKVPLDDMNHGAKTKEQICEEIVFGSYRLEQIKEQQRQYQTERKGRQISFLEAFLMQLSDELTRRETVSQAIKSTEERAKEYLNLRCDFDFAHLVQAIRSNELVGNGTCTEIDECWNDDELIEELQENHIYTAKEAIQWAIEWESLRIEYAANHSSGDHDCRLIKRANAWAKAVESYHKSN